MMLKIYIKSMLFKIKLIRGCKSFCEFNSFGKKQGLNSKYLTNSF